ncbi:MAG: cytochrome c oxidase subunit II, partial [Acidimicrobiales bacterium]
ITSSLPLEHPRHLRRVVAVWVVLSAIAAPIVYYVLGPHMAPGTQTTSAASQQFDLTVLSTAATPVVLAVYIWFGYSLIFFRQKKGEPLEDGAWVPKDSAAVQISWLVVTAALVISLFGFGTYELITPAGAGGGEGPSAIWTPAGVRTSVAWAPVANPAQLQVQVIAQQWKFTYRWPQFGGVETTTIDLPVDTPIKFNVTSLDVIHSFWAYRLGVKADANPGINNIAFTEATQTGPFTVRCAELCGLWHGAMVNPGAVVSKSTFYRWITTQEEANAAITAQLPPYSLSYTPSLHGAGGGYYQGNDTPHPTSPSK